MLLKLLILLIGVTGAAAESGMNSVTVTPVVLPHLPLGLVMLPNGKGVNLTVAAGAGAFRSPTDSPRRLWVISDRGPSLDCGSEHASAEKMCPGGRRGRMFLLPGYSPSIYAIEMQETTARFTEMVTLKGVSGRPLSGLLNMAPPGQEEASLAADGRVLEPDPSGIEPGGLVRLSDGTFFIADGYGPSLVEVSPTGTVRRRLVPEGLADSYRGADYPIEAVLPASLADRSFGRGFAGIALAPDERYLLVALQSPMQPKDGRPATLDILVIETRTGRVMAELPYPLDVPSPEKTDQTQMVSHAPRLVELVSISDKRLLVLERNQAAARIVRVDLSQPADQRATPERPQTLNTTVLFTTDRVPGLFGRLTGMAVLSPYELAVTSSELGIDSARTQLFRLTFSASLTN